MEIHNIDLRQTDLIIYQGIINKCKEIINENLQVKGGTLKQADILQKDFDWSNLIIAIIENKMVGFALIRTSQNTHNLKDSNNYYYLSDIVVENEYKKLGIGTSLIEAAIASTKEIPLVSSVLTKLK